MPLVFFDDPVADGKAQSHSLAHFLRGEEGLKDMFLYLRWDSRAIILDNDLDTKSTADGLNEQFALFRLHGLQAVGQYIHDRDCILSQH